MILITGATGLVGSHLVLQLLQTNPTPIRAMFRNSDSINKTKALFISQNQSELFELIIWVEADITDVPSLEVAFENIDFVYHCAALISFDPNDEKILRKINIEGTANIVNFCIHKKIKKLVHVSSIAALGDLTIGEKEITEKSEWNPEKLHSDYAISKFGAEMEVWRAQQEGVATVIVNPGVIIGAGFWQSGSGLLFTSIKKGLSFYTSGTSGFICVTDVVKAMQILMENNTQGERFILIAENISYQQVLIKIAQDLKVKKPSIQAQAWLLKIAWRLDWLFCKLTKSKRKISRYGVNSLLSSDFISNQKLTELLQFNYQSVDQCIEEVAAQFPK
jgi:nucleoside-diphosphate-sugar epimerase